MSGPHDLTAVEETREGSVGSAGTGGAGQVGLEPFRRQLDRLDEQIAKLLGERFQTCREIAIYKREHEIPMMQPHRVREVRARYLARGVDVDLPADFTERLFELLIGATCKMEDELIDQTDLVGTPGPLDVGPRFARKAPAEAHDGRELASDVPGPAQRELA
jgi:4-amino-4-deoxychorismate mutase